MRTSHVGFLAAVLASISMILAHAETGNVHPLFGIADPAGGPFPSDRLTISDPRQNTGLRVNLPKPDCGQRPSDCEDIDVINTFVKPCLRRSPLALHGAGRDTEHFGNLLVRESAEETQLDDFVLPVIERCQSLRTSSNAMRSNRLLRSRDLDILDTHAVTAASTLESRTPARALHDDSAHQSCSDGEEVSAILPAHRVLLDELHVGFMNERRRLQRVIGFAPHLPPREPPQLPIHYRHQPFERAAVPGSPRNEQLRNVSLAHVHL